MVVSVPSTPPLVGLSWECYICGESKKETHLETKIFFFSGNVENSKASNSPKRSLGEFSRQVDDIFMPKGRSVQVELELAAIQRMASDTQ